MDPNTTLVDILSLAKDILESAETADALDLAEKVLILHEWICGGGFLPRKWSQVKKSC